MPLDPLALDRILRAGDTARVIVFFAGAAEAERRAVAAPVLAWHRLLETNLQSHYLGEKALKKLGPFEVVANPRSYQPAAYAALLACAGLAPLKGIRQAFIDETTLVAILRDRRPEWLQAYADALLDHELNSRSGHGWRLVRALVRAGLCEAPAHDNYALEALPALGAPPAFDSPTARLADAIASHPDWLETAFWRLFEVDGTGEVSLTSLEKYSKSQGNWSEALVELSGRGVLPRGRLLDASLEALSRDFIQFRAGWFSRFHEALRPTAAERAGRLDAYLNLLASAIPPTVSFALAAVESIDLAAPISPARLLPALKPVLQTRAKGPVVSALGLLDRIAARDPASRAAACTAGVAALLHESADVQKTVLGFLARHGRQADPALRARVAELAGAVAPSLRGRLSSWLDAPATPPPAPASAPSLPPGAVRVSRIDPSRALAPIETLDDLLDLAGKVLETPDDPHELERLFDGLSRLCDQRPKDFARRAGPLRKRAAKRWSASAANWPRWPTAELAVARAVLAWIDERDPFEKPSASADNPVLAAWLGRLDELAGRLIRREARPLFSAATHRGGWIDPAVLACRWQSWEKCGDRPSPPEQLLARQRLAPDGHVPAGATGETLRQVLSETADTGQDAVWTWAAFIETHTFQERTYSSLRIGIHVADEGRPTAQGDEQASFPTDWIVGAGLLRWWALFKPADPEEVFAEAACRICCALDFSEVDDRDTALLLEPLSESHTELRPMACLALALGLAACGADLRGHARDALVAIVSEDRLEAAALGSTMGRLLDTGANCFSRWAKSLGEAARVSPAHAAAAGDLLQRALTGDPARAPRDLAQLLARLLELLSELGNGVQNPATRDYLGQIKGSGKAPKLAAQLLKL